MTPNLIGLVGRSGAGKDTIGGALVAGHGYARVAFGDALKRAAYASDPLVELAPYGDVRRLADLVDMLGWDAAKKFADVRRYLQRYGTAVRGELPGAWLTIAGREIARHLGAGRSVVVTDVRFPDEVDAVHAFGGVVIRLDRAGAGEIGANAEHVSEQAESLDVDLVVRNALAPDRVASLINAEAGRLRGHWHAALTPPPDRKELVA